MTKQRSNCECSGLNCRIDAGDRRHGTVNAYSQGCRCSDCRTAASRSTRQRALSKKRSNCLCEGKNCAIDAGDSRHGTLNGYGNLKCRCELCREANAEYYQNGRGSLNKAKYRASLLAKGMTVNSRPVHRTKRFIARQSQRHDAKERVLLSQNEKTALHKTWPEFVADVLQYYRTFSHTRRYGESFSNYLAVLYPEVHAKMVEASLDPFYDTIVGEDVWSFVRNSLNLPDRIDSDDG